MATRKRNGSNGHAHQIEREQRELECKLTEAEFKDRSDKMAAAELEIEKLKEQRKGVNGAIANAAAERGKLAHVIDTMTETRMVDCAWMDDFPKNVKRLIRQDTGAEVDTRPMSSEDRQATLSLLPPVDAEAPTQPPTPITQAKKRGRPKGAKNKPSGSDTTHAH